MSDITPLDLDQDGTPESALADLDADGLQESLYVSTPEADALLTDLNLDGQYDYAFVDVNHDGQVDQVYQDDNGQWVVATDESQVPADVQAEPYVTNTTTTTTPASYESVSDPLHDYQTRSAWEASFWQYQVTNGFCGPFSAAMVISEALGQPVDGNVLVQQAYDMGILQGQPGDWQGMTTPDLVTLMDSMGVPSSMVDYTDANQAWDALVTDVNDSNTGIIAMVDGDENWYKASDDLQDGGSAPNHFVVVAAVTDDFVYLNDPGSPDGQWMEVPKDVFMSSWEDSGYIGVRTDSPLPGPEIDTTTNVVDTQQQPYDTVVNNNVVQTAVDGYGNPVQTQVPVYNGGADVVTNPATNQPLYATVTAAHPWSPAGLPELLAGKVVEILPIVIPAAAIGVVTGAVIGAVEKKNAQ